MGMVFALGSGVTDITIASPLDIETGMRITFGVAVVLIVSALGFAVVAKVVSQCRADLGPEQSDELGHEKGLPR